MGSGVLFVVHWLVETAVSPSCVRRKPPGPGLCVVVPCTFRNCVRQMFDSAHPCVCANTPCAFVSPPLSLYHSSFSFVKNLRNDLLLSQCAFLYIGVTVISIKIKALHPHSPPGLQSLHGYSNFMQCSVGRCLEHCNGSWLWTFMSSTFVLIIIRFSVKCDSQCLLFEISSCNGNQFLFPTNLAHVGANQCRLWGK